MTKKSLLLSILVGIALVGCQKADEPAVPVTTAPGPGGGQVKTAPTTTGTKSPAQGMAASGLKVGGGNSNVGANAKGGN